MSKKKDPIKVINTEQAEQVDPGEGLEDAGWKRDEQLARRTDDLAEAAEQASEEREVYAFDPSKFDPDREIQSQLDELEVEDAQPNRRYLWCFEGQNGRFVMLARRQGWIVVQSEDPEASTLKDARGYRKIGDTILMWTSVENYEKIQYMREYKNLRREQAVSSGLKQLNDEYAKKGVFIVDPTERNIGGKSLMDAMQRRGARQTAMQHVSGQLKDGTVPGMPAPKKGGA